MFHVGDRFASFEELLVKLEQYKIQTGHDFYIRDSRTLSGHLKRYPERLIEEINPAIEYYYVRVSCPKGGRKYTSRGTGKRLKPTKKLSDCEAGITFKATKCFQFLEVKEVNVEHKHDVATMGSNKVENQDIINKEITLDEKSRVALDLYAMYLTSDGYEKLRDQLVLSRNCETISINKGDVFSMKGNDENTVEVTPKQCQCIYFGNMQLPCEHILKCRRTLDMTLFDPDLCGEKWRKNFLISPEEGHHEETITIEALNDDMETGAMPCDVQCEVIEDTERLNSIVQDQCQKLVELCKDVTANVLCDRLNTLKTIIENWSNGSTCADHSDLVRQTTVDDRLRHKVDLLENENRSLKKIVNELEQNKELLVENKTMLTKKLADYESKVKSVVLG